MLQILDDATFRLSEPAAREVERLLAEESRTKSVRALRLGVRGGGCSGLSYFMEFADAPEPKDRIFEQHGVAVYIDFSSSVQSSGFKWNNPNEKKSCGCGESFSV
jgi:iron-sulfur cluster assembly protein